MMTHLPHASMDRCKMMVGDKFGEGEGIIEVKHLLLMQNGNLSRNKQK